MKEPYRYRVSIHEAGHAFMLFHNRRSVDWVCVDMAKPFKPGECQSVEKNIPKNKVIQQEILPAVGGYAAEMVVNLIDDTIFKIFESLRKDDYDKANKSAKNLKVCVDEYGNCDEEKADNLVGKQLIKAIGIIRSRKNVLKKLANRIYMLSDGEKVSGAELREIYDKYIL